MPQIPDFPPILPRTCYNSLVPSSYRKPPLNFKKLLIVAFAAVALIVGWKYLTRVNATDPVAVGTAFTKALKSHDTATASTYIVPERAAAWRTTADENIGKMRSGTLERFYEGIPSSPGFTAVAGATATAMKLESADKAFSLEMSQSGGKWFVSKGPI